VGISFEVATSRQQPPALHRRRLRPIHDISNDAGMRARRLSAGAGLAAAGDNDNACFSALEKETPGTRPARLVLRMLAIVIVCVAYHAVVAVFIA
jgi:hypothetical protein